MQLKDLVGRHMLLGVETGSIILNQQDCDYVKFNLGGVSYMAVEYPVDGYGSYCMLTTSDTKPSDQFCNEVDCVINPDGEDDLIMTDAELGCIVLEIGTKYDDWHPMFHFSYRPEDMACNLPVDEVEEPSLTGLTDLLL